MNPLVSEMLSTRAGQDVELRFLEDLLNDDCKCACNHEYNGTVCSYEVTHLRTMICGNGGTICLNAARDAMSAMRDKSHDCGYCDRHVEDCWEIRPI